MKSLKFEYHFDQCEIREFHGISFSTGETNVWHFFDPKKNQVGAKIVILCIEKFEIRIPF